MQRWVCPNCSHGNSMHQHHCTRCRFEPVGLDLPLLDPRPPAFRAEPTECAGSPTVDAVVLTLLALLAGWLARIAMTLPLEAQIPFALYLAACTWVGIWIVYRRRGRIRRT